MRNVRMDGQPADTGADADSPLPFAAGQGEYDPRALTDLEERISEIVLMMDSPFPRIIEELGKILMAFFKTERVDFLMREDEDLVLEYVNIPEDLARSILQATGMTSILGMRIPLFAGSSFRELIDCGAPRELMTRKELLRSFRDFLPPDSPRHVELRKRFASVLMDRFGYNYIYQVPLVSMGQVVGYFAFIQRGRIRCRMRVDLALISGQIADLLVIRRQIEHREKLFENLPNPTIRFSVIHPRTSDGAVVSGKACADCPGTVAGTPAHAICIVAAVNPAFEALFGVSRSALVGKQVSDPALRAFFPDCMAEMVAVYRTAIPRRIEFLRDGRWLALIVSRIDDGELIMTAEDITAGKKAEEEIRQLALHDSLTGLYNRHVFMDILARELLISRRESVGLCLFFLDLNRFKQVNDTWGHETGDRLIRHVAGVLTAAVRSSDTTARFGGDEFVVLCRKAAPETGPLIAGKLAAALHAAPFAAGGTGIVMTASIGVAVFPSGARTPEELVTAADQAMYRAKREGLAYCMAGT